jgi:hypothetical protein
VNKAKVSISCLGEVSTISNGEVNLLFSPHFNDVLRVSTNAYVIERICGNIPSVNIPVELSKQYEDLMLADPRFNEKGTIDILLGVNVFFTLLNGEILKRSENLPFAISSKLGWIIAGKATFESSETEPISVNNFHVSSEELIKSFWELEQIPSQQILTKEEKLCETHFVDNCSRNEEGRYIVKLPFKPERPILGNSKASAFNKFLSLERRLLKDPKIYEQYKHFMHENIYILAHGRNC